MRLSRSNYATFAIVTLALVSGSVVVGFSNDSAHASDRGVDRHVECGLHPNSTTTTSTTTTTVPASTPTIIVTSPITSLTSITTVTSAITSILSSATKSVLPTTTTTTGVPTFTSTVGAVFKAFREALHQKKIATPQCGGA